MESPFDSGGKDLCDSATSRDFQVASRPWKLDEGSKESLLEPLEGEWSQDTLILDPRFHTRA